MGNNLCRQRQHSAKIDHKCHLLRSDEKNASFESAQAFLYTTNFVSGPFIEAKPDDFAIVDTFTFGNLIHNKERRVHRGITHFIYGVQKVGLSTKCSLTPQTKGSWGFHRCQ